jgi:predicted RNA-binding protein with TRAM domain
MTKKCPTCGGDGIVVSEQTAAIDVERRLRTLPTPGSRSKAFKVEVNARVASLVAGPAAERLLELEETTKRRFFLVGKEDVHLDHFRVLEQGTLEKVAPALPMEIGQELDLKLGELGLHDPHAGVAKVDGVDVSVAHAAKLVGKKVKARVTAVTDGFAWAELLSPVEAAEPPLTAEAEAEKPTRARRPSRRRADAEEVVVADVDEDEGLEDVAPVEDEVGEPAAAEGDELAEAAAAKKRTRRGSRGGRNRRKKPAGATATDGAEADSQSEPEADEADDVVAAEVASDLEPAAETDVGAEGGGEPTGPVIHVPGRELEEGAEDGSEDGGAQPAKKRTRRGSRGGRNRRKRPAGAVEGAAVAEGGTEEIEEEPGDDLAADLANEVSTNGSEAEVAEEVAEAVETEPEAETADEPEAERDAGDSGEWAYTPMSDWGLDDE